MIYSIEVQNLIKRFGNHEAVAGINFNIKKGEVFGLLGPNGAGKTTTIRMLATLLPSTSGRIVVEGLDVLRQGGQVRQVIGYVPQALSADGTLTGYENLLLFAKLLRLDRQEREKRIGDILALLNLQEAAHKLVREYSGGMVRRLEIGQAILHRPQVLILDEPTVGLDPVARHTVWNTLKQLREETGLTILITTHYMEEAEAACQRVAIMNRGRIVAQGTPAELKKATGNPGATLENVFTYYTGDQLETGGSFLEIRKTRRRVQRFN
ncbi:ATP-binding cassette domain-containing protein [Moorella naiadis]|uniref:ABC transporter ATP-binding protein n=1 Tax=Moorella naiadis (nom. illeg.) TaxID=3093670 RepID=UPI003D9C9F13